MEEKTNQQTQQEGVPQAPARTATRTTAQMRQQTIQQPIQQQPMQAPVQPRPQAVVPDERDRRIAELEARLADAEKEKRIAELERREKELELKSREMERPVINRPRPAIEDDGTDFDLPHEFVTVKFIKKKRGSVEDAESPMFGGMAENARKVFVVPRMRNGRLVNVLTSKEEKYFEKLLRLPEGAFSIYNKGDENYWLDSTPGAVNKVALTKNGIQLNLSVWEDYIKWKILLANTNEICPSEEKLKRSPLATYLFVLCNEKVGAELALKRAELKMECYDKFRMYRENRSVLKWLVEKMENRRLAPNTTFTQLYPMVDELIDRDAEKFHEAITSQTLEMEAMLMEALDCGVVTRNAGQYYMTDNGDALCDSNNKPYLNVAATWLRRNDNADVRERIRLQIDNKRKI